MSLVSMKKSFEIIDGFLRKIEQTDQNSQNFEQASTLNLILEANNVGASDDEICLAIRRNKLIYGQTWDWLESATKSHETSYTHKDLTTSILDESKKPMPPQPQNETQKKARELFLYHTEETFPSSNYSGKKNGFTNTLNSIRYRFMTMASGGEEALLGFNPDEYKQQFGVTKKDKISGMEYQEMHVSETIGDGHHRL